MENSTKAEINLKEGTIKLEGNEEFVCKYLDDFKDKLFDHQSKQEKHSLPITKKITKKVKTRKRIIKKIEVEGFDTKGDSQKEVPSLKEFFNEKRPGESNYERILVIGHYVTKILRDSEFSEGNVEFAYKILKLKPRPQDLHQTHIDIKNKKRWIDNGTDSSHWVISRIGENEIETEMPRGDNT
ncbi:MAG: hypothetical protein ABH849_03365 [Nanoarchaeota archaeon]